jgi:SAM-dependent methyltransferase
MSHPIIEIPPESSNGSFQASQSWVQWLSTPLGRYLKAWEQCELDAAVVDIFGYHAVQLDGPEINGLATNRMPHRWHIFSYIESTQTSSDRNLMPCDLVADSAALPFAASSLDLAVLPHTLELSQDPHATLREVERVLVPEGHLVITGMNPVSLWGWHQRRTALYKRFGWGHENGAVVGQLIGYWRMRDWLRLLGFEVQISRFGCWRPALQNKRWLSRFAWLDRWGAKWWPILGGAYILVAVKRVPGTRVLGRTWKKAPAQVGGAIPATHRHHSTQRTADGAPVKEARKKSFWIM